MAHARSDGRSAAFKPLQRTNQTVRPNRQGALPILPQCSGLKWALQAFANCIVPAWLTLRLRLSLSVTLSLFCPFARFDPFLNRNRDRPPSSRSVITHFFISSGWNLPQPGATDCNCHVQPSLAIWACGDL